MMNLSMSHPVPTFGDSLTITCYVCGMPSSKEWAQKARSRPTTPMKPYFPFLLQMNPTGGAILREDGSTYLCAFCHASLEAQWSMYELQQVIPPPNRKYNIQKFICAVCGVETYRKRVRALPFQEFPFLEKQRQSGSITLGNNPLAVVCLDCSETLWAQSAEYDRWGLPVQKRHFNWMARPPPPEDSVEATVARLPSGETQLPRCPPTEPTLNPSKMLAVEPPSTVKIMESQMTLKARSSKDKGASPKLDTSSPLPHQSSSGGGRKISLTSTTPPSLDIQVGGYHSQQPPVVTVAPMSSHTTVISMRKDSLGLPPGMIPHQHQSSSGGLYPPTAMYQTPVTAAATYTPYAVSVWGNHQRGEATSQRPIEATYPFGPSEAAGIHHQAQGPWPWLPHPSSDLLRYQTYVSSLHNRSRIVETPPSGRSPTHASSEGGAASSSASYGELESPTRFISSSLATSSITNVDATEDRRVGSSYEHPVYPGGGKGSPEPLKSGKKSPKIMASRESSSGTKPFPSHSKKDSSASSGDTIATVTSPSLATPSTSSTATSNEEKAVHREFHIPKKRNWHVFMKDSPSSSTTSTSSSATGNERTSTPVTPPPPAIHHPKKKKTSMSSEYPMTMSGPTSSNTKDAITNKSSLSSRDSPRAIDLSAAHGQHASKSKGTGQSQGQTKFRIEYLCQSDQSEEKDDMANRTSVICCAPKGFQSMDDDQDENNSSQKYVESTSSDEDNPAPSSANAAVASSLHVGEDIEGKVEENDKSKVTSGDGDKLNDEKKEKDDDEDEERGISSRTTCAANKQEKEKSDDDKKEGKSSERQAKKLPQDSTMNTDDDDEIEKNYNETKNNEDLHNIEQLIKETVLELVSRERELEKVHQEKKSKQTEFLNKLGLVTPDKKIDLELKSIVSRHDRKTLPPLQLRADSESKFGPKIDKQLKQLLLKVALEDPSLFQETPEAEKCDFMKELGMKTAETSDKTKREIKWRVILMERMRRELRDAGARGVKHEWEKSDILKKFAECDLESFFSSLSFAALQQATLASSSEDKLSGPQKKKVKISENEVTSNLGGGGSGVCINYPKYIPSYAVGGGGGATVKIEEGEEDSRVDVADDTRSTSPSNFAAGEPILKIPVVPPKHRLQSESTATTVNSDTDDSEVGGSASSSHPEGEKILLNQNSNGGGLQKIDSLIQSSATYWQNMKRSIDDILNDMESSKEDVPLEEKTDGFDKLRKHLKSQLSDIKEIEKRLRATGKTILNASRKKNQNQNHQQKKFTQSE